VRAVAGRRAALVMDRADLSYRPAALQQAYPGLPRTPLSECLQPPGQLA
jgi:hypothetical protein